MDQWPVRGVLSPLVLSRDERIDFPHVSGVARGSAVCTSPVWSLQESCDSPGDAGVVCTPATPVAVLAIVGAAPPWPVDVPRQRRLGVEPSSLPTGSRRDVPRPLLAPPVVRVAPWPGLVRMAQPDPRAALWAPLCVHRLARLVTTDRGDGVAPASDHRVHRLHQACLCLQPMAAPHCPYRALLTGHRLPARGAAGLVTARGRRGGWPHVDAQAVTPGLTLLNVSGMGEAGLARVPGQSPVASMVRQDRLTALEHCPRGMSDAPSIRLAPHRRTASTGQRARDRLFQAVQGHGGEYGRGRATVRCPRVGGTPCTLVAPANLQPGGALPAPGRRRVQRASPGVVVEAIAALGDVRLQHPRRLRVELDRARAKRIPGAPAWATALAVGFERRFPGRFQGWGDPTWLGPVGAGGHPHGPRCRRAGCGQVDPTHR